MEELQQIFFLLLNAALAFGIGCMGKKRKIGFWWAFVLSFINLLLGLIITVCSKKNTSVEFVDINKHNIE